MLALLLRLALANPVLPELTGEDLLGRAHHLPQELSTERTVVFLGFQRRHQGDINTWMPLASELVATGRSEWLELPFMGDIGSWLQSVLLVAMRADLREEHLRARTVPLFVDSAAARAQLGDLSEEHLVVLVLDRHGSVLGSVLGPLTPTSEAVVRSLVGP